MILVFKIDNTSAVKVLYDLSTKNYETHHKSISASKSGFVRFITFSGTPVLCRQQLSRQYARFPNIKVDATTIGKRNYLNLKENFEKYVPLRYGFNLLCTYDHPRVICKVMERDESIPLYVSVKGRWWDNCPADEKHKQYTGIVVSKENESIDKYNVYFGNEHCIMNSKTIEHYSCGPDVISSQPPKKKQKRNHCSNNRKLEMRNKQQHLARIFKQYPTSLYVSYRHNDDGVNADCSARFLVCDFVGSDLKMKYKKRTITVNLKDIKEISVHY